MIKALYIELESIDLGWFSIGESANITKAITDYVKELEEMGPTKKTVASSETNGD
jgi:coenzyme F420-reducing hydrogenase delta subunit